MSLYLLFFLLFIIFGVLLHFTRGYDLFTISLIYIIAAIFMYFIDLYSVIYLFLFFIIAELITQKVNKKHKKRNYYNIIGNCFAGVIILIVGYLLTTYLINISFTYFKIGAIISIATAFSDTLSSEIGMLSKYRPVLITNFKKVKKGTDGGISFLGIGGAVLAALITFLFFYFIGYEYFIALVISLFAILGSLVDSYLGAIFEIRNKLNNNQTNFFATLITGLIYIIIQIII